MYESRRHDSYIGTDVLRSYTQVRQLEGKLVSEKSERERLIERLRVLEEKERDAVQTAVDVVEEERARERTRREKEQSDREWERERETGFVKFRKSQLSFTPATQAST